MNRFQDHDAYGPRLTFWGAAQSVTGSMHLVEHRGQKLLLDCGAVRSPRHPAQPSHTEFPTHPAELHAVVISHAHIDHCGNLPALVHHGFHGPIYCTRATCDLLALVLKNSARIQEEDAYVHHVVARPGAAEHTPLFARSDVEQMLEQCVPLEYEEARIIGDGLQLRFTEAGHILGSAMTALTMTEAGPSVRLTYTGDLGRLASFLLRDPGAVPEAEWLISECTYGGRGLDSVAQARVALEEVVRRTIERGGKVLIPAFSLGRTQVVLFALQQAMAAGRVPRAPIYVDSPLAAEITKVYCRHAGYLKPDAAAGLDGELVHYLRFAEDSQKVSQTREPSIIIAPSGMCEGGRIVHHLKLHLDDPRCSIVLVNYQAPHTPGRRLLERGPTVRLHGKKWNKWADVVYLAGFSGHGDHQDLLGLLGPLPTRTHVRLVHGEPAQAQALAASLRSRGFSDIAIPARGESERLTS